MSTQPNGAEAHAAPAALKPPLDPLRRVFVPIEQKTPKGTIVFRTTDNLVYARAQEGGPMYRAIPKVRGKAARAADKRQRRMARQHNEKRTTMAQDPREDRYPNDPDTDSSPDKGEARPATGGAGTGTKDDPAGEPDAKKDGDA